MGIPRTPPPDATQATTLTTTEVTTSTTTLTTTIGAATTPTSILTPSHPRYRAVITTTVNPIQLPLPSRIPEAIIEEESTAAKEEAAQEELEAERSLNSTPDTQDLNQSVTSTPVYSTPVSSINDKPNPGETDPHAGLSFQQRLDFEPERRFYQSEMAKISHKSMRFQKAVEDATEEIQHPEGTAERANNFMRELCQAWDALKKHRKLAISKFSFWTRSQDHYLIYRHQTYKKVKDDYFNRFILFNLKMEEEEEDRQKMEAAHDTKGGLFTDPNTENAKFFCTQCANPGFATMFELKQHQQIHQADSSSKKLPLEMFDQDHHRAENYTSLVPQPNQRNSNSSFLPVIRRNNQFKCQFCPDQFQTQDEMERHVLHIHGEIGTQTRPPNSLVSNPIPHSYPVIPLQRQQVQQLPSQQFLSQQVPPKVSDNNTLGIFDPLWDYQPTRSQPIPLLPPSITSSNNLPYYRNDFRTIPDVPSRRSNNPEVQMIAETLKEAFRSQNEVFEESRMREFERAEAHRIREAQRTAEINFQQEAKSLCGIFDPDKIQDKSDLLHEFSYWLTDLMTLEKRMIELDFDEIKKYRTLRQHVQGTAKTCTWVEIPRADSYEQAKKKLKERYYSKAMATRDLYRKLKNLPKIPDENHQKVTQIITDILTLIEQLENRNPSKEEIWFLLFTELIEPRFNRVAVEIFEKKRLEKANEEKSLGHDLTMNDLKQCLIDTRTKIANRELNKFFNKAEQKPNNNQDKKQQEDQDKGKRNTLFGQSTSNEKQVSNAMPPNQSNPGICPVDGCEASTEPGGKGHQYVLYCPVFKKMTTAQRWAWFKKNNCKCKKCMSISHEFDDCPIKSVGTCKEIVNEGPKQGQECNMKHNKLLHYVPKARLKGKGKNSSNATSKSKGSTEEDQATSQQEQI